MRIGNPKDFFGGAILVLIAATMGVGVVDLPIGSASRMGPGYFPALLCIVLGFLGAVIMLNGLRHSEEKLERTSWRALILIVLPIVFFGYSLRRLGLAPTLGITVFVTSMASQQWNAVQSALLAGGVVVCGWLIFIKGLGLPIPTFGPVLNPLIDIMRVQASAAETGCLSCLADIAHSYSAAAAISSVLI